MTATAAAPPLAAGARRRGRGRIVVVGIVVLVLAALAFGAPSDRVDVPLDPSSTGPTGARGLVLFLEELGADVELVVGSPPPDADTAVLLVDRLTIPDVEATEAWIADGGVLLAVDRGGPLTAAAVDGPCPRALDGVERLRLSELTVLDREAGGDDSCFGRFVRTAPRGAGALVTLDTADPLVNELLDEADNAVLAAAVLAPAAGTRVAFVTGPSPGGAAAGADEDDTLVDLIPTSTRQAILQAGIALAVWVAWRARRLGRPIVEDQPVAVAGSELVVAVGRLLDARRRPDEAAATLRADTRRALTSRLGLPADVDDRTLAAAVADRSTLDQDRAAAALGERPVVTDGDLLAVAADLDHIRTDLLGSRPT